MNHFATSTYPLTDARILRKQRVRTKTAPAIEGQHRSFLLYAVFLLLVLSVLLYVWTRIQVVQLGYEISSAVGEKETVILAHNELKVEIATLRSAQRLEKKAREQLGMSLPNSNQLIIIR